jgi:16S rRNA (uracil1498-N3)-methyltransferase
MALFYTENIDKSPIILDESESGHCIRSLRYDKGARISLSDGRGHVREAVIEDPHPKKTRLIPTGEVQTIAKPAYSLHIAMAPTKQIDRFEFFVEKAVELGIDRITPLLCENSERRQTKTDRLQKLAIAAMKQSQGSYLPQIDDVAGFGGFVDRCQDNKMDKLIAYCSGRRQMVNKTLQPKKPYLILIGPEGDFAPAEVERAKINGFSEISLGRERLRTETSGIMICASLKYLNL